MGHYFEDGLSIGARNNDDVRSTLRTVAGRYIGENPPTSPLFRLDSSLGIRRLSDYRYRFDLAERFSDAPDFSFVYAWGTLRMEESRIFPMALSLNGPLTVWINGEVAFKSHIGHERTADQKHFVEAPLKAGWNNFVLEFLKTPRGFGGIFGTANKKSSAFHFLCPSAEGAGAAGWLFTRPLRDRLPRLPAVGESEATTGTDWLPRRSWTEEELRHGIYRRLFGMREGLYARSWAKGDFRQRADEYHLMGSCEGPFTIWIDGVEAFHTERKSWIDVSVKVRYGIHDIVVEARCGSQDWGFTLQASGAEGPVRIISPAAVQGCDKIWLHTGPFSESCGGRISDCMDLRKPVHTADGPSYFRVDQPGAFLRPFMEGGNFGHWHYPIGVNLYGLLVAGRILESADIESYAQQHLQFVADWYEQIRWDGAFFGAASMLHHLFQMDCLDDCGSAGAATLEAALRVGLEGFRPLVDDIARYIEDGQERLSDGTFYRNKSDNPFMAGTIWSDDLYMSVPFLCRYRRISSEERFLDDAIRQFKLYREYLFMDGPSVMCHVYDVTAALPNRVAWGRGNGWVLFSLAELLSELPSDHPARGELLDFYETLCGGILRLQDSDGMWHQILTDPESFPEASCTSMFLYSFARGLRMGWLTDEAYDEAVRRAWHALCNNAVDFKGNVYGVCRGTGFSFTDAYYKDELGWKINDLHGIGILLLAGSELLNLERSRTTRKG